MRDHAHAKLLCLLILKFLERNSGGPLQVKYTPEMKAGIEQLAEEILVFFSDADSFRRNWILPSTQEEHEKLEKGMFGVTYDAEENEASELARRGDFRSLEGLIFERGYLRTYDARELAVGRMQGIKKRGPPNSGVNVEMLMQVLEIQIKQDCTEYAAKKIWLERNPDVEEETFKSQLSRAKKSKKGQAFVAFAKLLAKRRVQNSGNSAP